MLQDTFKYTCKVIFFTFPGSYIAIITDVPGQHHKIRGIDLKVLRYEWICYYKSQVLD